MFDRDADEPSFFVQMTSTAVCGPLARGRQRLPLVASWEMRWAAWKALYPDTRVVSYDTGFARSYDINFNAEYEELDNPDRLISVPLDHRRPPKERVLGVPVGAVPEGYRDEATGSLWRLDGLAMEGPHSGRRLEPVEEAYVAFWFAWADFHPETVLRKP